MPTAAKRNILSPGTALVLLSTGVLGVSLRPGLTWFDSGELVSGAFHLGISHPPGQGPWSLLVKPFLLLPFGSVAFRVSLFSLVCCVAAVWLVYDTIVALLRAGGRAPGRRDRWLAALIVLPLVVHEYFALQATRQEVYGLILLLHAACARLFASALGSRRGAVWMGLVAAYEVNLNPLLAAPLAPLLLTAAVTNMRRHGWRAPACMLGAFCVPFLVLFYLPLRSLAGSIVDWGEPVTWASFVRVVTASQYSSDFMSGVHSPLIDRGVDNYGGFFSACGLVYLVLAGSAVLFTRRRPRLGVVAILATAALTPWTSIIQPRFLPDNPDYKAYLSSGIVLMVCCAGVGFVHLARYLRGRPVSVVLRVALTVALVASAAGTHLQFPARHHRDYRAERLALELLSLDVAERLALVLWTDNMSFPVLYAQQVGGLRPESILAIPPMFAAKHVRDRLIDDALLADELGGSEPTVADLGRLGFRIVIDTNRYRRGLDATLVPVGPAYRLTWGPAPDPVCDFSALARLLAGDFGPSKDPIGRLSIGFLLFHAAQLLVEYDQPRCLPALLDLALAWERGEEGTFAGLRLGPHYDGEFLRRPTENPNLFRYAPGMLDALAGDVLLTAGRGSEGFTLLERGANENSLRSAILRLCWELRLGRPDSAARWLDWSLERFPRYERQLASAHASCRAAYPSD